MLPKQHRLTRREDFATVFAKGIFTGTSEGIAIKFCKNDTDFTRIGFPIGKNFSKKATERNRARRVLRAATSQYLNNLKSGYDIIVLLKPDRKNIDFKNISLDLKKVFTKSNLLF